MRAFMVYAILTTGPGVHLDFQQCLIGYEVRPFREEELAVVELVSETEGTYAIFNKDKLVSLREGATCKEK